MVICKPQTQLQATTPNGRRPLQNLHRADAGGSRLAWAIGASQINSHGVRGLIALHPNHHPTAIEQSESNRTVLALQESPKPSRGQDAKYKSSARCFPFPPIDRSNKSLQRSTENPYLTLTVNMHDLDTCEF